MRLSKTVLAAAAAVLLASGCLTNPTPWVGTEGPYVGTVGDSLVHGAETGGGVEENDPDRFLSDDLVAAGFHSSVAATIGAKTADLDTVQGFPEPQPDIIVIGLGTNDIRVNEEGQHVPVEEAAQKILDYIDAHGAPCNALITITETTTWGLDQSAPPYNDALESTAAAHDDIVIADWAPVIAAHPEWVREDGIHHTDEGQEAYRQLIVATAEECEALINA